MDGTVTRCVDRLFPSRHYGAEPYLHELLGKSNNQQSLILSYCMHVLTAMIICIYAMHFVRKLHVPQTGNHADTVNSAYDIPAKGITIMHLNIHYLVPKLHEVVIMLAQNETQSKSHGFQ